MVPPVPIPNTVVKHVKAESTWLETAREDRKLPVKISDTPFGVSLIFIARSLLSDRGTRDGQGAGEEGAQRRTSTCESAMQA